MLKALIKATTAPIPKKIPTILNLVPVSKMFVNVKQ
jgi:hypothetical protein